MADVYAPMAQDTLGEDGYLDDVPLGRATCEGVAVLELVDVTGKGDR